MQPPNLARMASRTIGFALIGAMPQHSLVEQSRLALDTAPELVGASVPKSRGVLATLAQGVLPSYEACAEARAEIEQLRKSYVQEEVPRELSPAPRA